MNYQAQNRGLSWSAGIMFAAGAVLILWLIIGLFASSSATEHYTELYFEQNQTLPKALSAKPIQFTFTIHNVEGQDTTYPYLIWLKGADGRKDRLGGGIVLVANGQMRSLFETVALPRGVKASEVEVVLPVQNQKIHFWLGANQ